MKNLTRSVSLALVLMLMLSLVGTSYAQDDFCLGLDEEDCALYYEVSENADSPLSSSFEMTTNFDFALDSPDEQQEFAFALFINGAYVVDADAMDAAVEEFAGTPVLDVSAGTFLDLARGSLESFDAELEIDYEAPAELGIPPLGPFNLWLVDGVGYVDLTPFSAFDPSLTGILGVNIFDLIEEPLSQIALGDLFEGMDGMGGGGFDGSFDMSDFGMDDENNPFAQFEVANLSEDEVSTFVTVERADDDTVDGVDVVVFVTTVDIAAAMEVDAIVASAYQSAVQSGMPDDTSEEDFGAALAESLAGSVVTVTEKIDAETGIAMQATIEVAVNFDLEPMATLFGEQEEGSITFNMTSDFALSDVNNVDAIEVPEDAQELPASALMGG